MFWQTRTFQCLEKYRQGLESCLLYTPGSKPSCWNDAQEIPISSLLLFHHFNHELTAVTFQPCELEFYILNYKKNPFLRSCFHLKSPINISIYTQSGLFYFEMFPSFLQPNPLNFPLTASRGTVLKSHAWTEDGCTGGVMHCTPQPTPEDPGEGKTWPVTLTCTCGLHACICVLVGMHTYTNESNTILLK